MSTEAVNEEIDFGELTADLRGGGRRGTDIVVGQRLGGSSRGTRSVAELEREVRELRHANETLKMYFTMALELDLQSPPPAAVFDMARERAGAHAVAPQPPAPRPHGGVRWAQEDPEEDRDAPPAKVEFRVLGPIEATIGGRYVDLGATKQRAALTLLVSQVGQPVSVDVLVEALWDGQPPQSAISSLHAYIANLRRVLEPDRAPRKPAKVLRTRGRGYLLDSSAVDVDAHRFGTCATAGWQALDRCDPQRALEEFEAGLALWRGEAYAEVSDATHVSPEVVRLEELRLSVVEGRCAALIAVGAHEVAVSELAGFTQSHPLREYGCELFSLALYRAGRQADALSVLRMHQRRMAEDLGISSSPALQRLEVEILRQAPTLD